MAETDPMMQAEFQSRVSLASENDRLRSRVAELTGERDSLMDQCHGLQRLADERDGLKRCVAELEGENTRLRTENANLRALLDDLVIAHRRYRAPPRLNAETIHRLKKNLNVALENASAALGGESSDFVLVPKSLLEPFVRIAERLEACQSSRKLPDSAPLSALMEDIPEVGAYVSLGLVRELARIARGDR